jgi:hypothetical protein
MPRVPAAMSGVRFVSGVRSVRVVIGHRLVVQIPWIVEVPAMSRRRRSGIGPGHRLGEVLEVAGMVGRMSRHRVDTPYGYSL